MKVLVKLWNTHRTHCESFGRAFSKARAVEGAQPSSTSPAVETIPGVFLFASFFFCAYMVKRKSD